MRIWRRLAGGLLVVMLGVAGVGLPAGAAPCYPDPGLVTGDVEGVHDPAMIRAADGRYILVSTGTNLDIRTSTARIAFHRIGSVWPDGASWTDPFTGGSRHLWAPDLSFHNGQYYVYYSASSFGSRDSAIFLATSPTAMPGSWTNHGLVVRTSDSDDHTAIDRNLVVDSTGRWWLTFGSFWTGIKMIRIDPATGKQHAGDPARYGLARRSSSQGGAVEAPYIVAREGY